MTLGLARRRVFLTAASFLATLTSYSLLRASTPIKEADIRAIATAKNTLPVLLCIFILNNKLKYLKH